MWAGLCSRFLVPEVIPEPQGWRWVSPIAGSALPHSLGPSPSLRQTTVAGAVLRDVPGAVAQFLQGRTASESGADRADTARSVPVLCSPSPVPSRRHRERPQGRQTHTGEITRLSINYHAQIRTPQL